MPTDSAPAEAIVSIDVPVRFAETDLMGVVHHASYLVWFEMGRVAWMDEVGMPYTGIAESGHHLAVTGINAAYRAAARFGDVVRVDAHLAQLRSRQVSFEYAICNAADGTVLVTGRSDHICVDLDGRMAKLPADILARLQAGATKLTTGV